MPPTLIERLKAHMESGAISTAQLADRLGVAAETVEQWLSEQTPLPAERAAEIEAMLPVGSGESASTPLDPRIARMIELAKGFDDASAGDAAVDRQSDTVPEPEHVDRKALGEVIQHAILDARRSKGLTQAEIAARIGVSPPQLTHWVRGYREIPDKHLLALARVLGLDFRQEFIRYFGAPREEPSDDDRELTKLVADLNEDAKAPLLKLLKRLQAK